MCALRCALYTIDVITIPALIVTAGDFVAQSITKVKCETENSYVESSSHSWEIGDTTVSWKLSSIVSIIRLQVTSLRNKRNQSIPPTKFPQSSITYRVLQNISFTLTVRFILRFVSLTYFQVLQRQMLEIWQRELSLERSYNVKASNGIYRMYIQRVISLFIINLLAE